MKQRVLRMNIAIRHKRERGVVIVLVAVFMLFVVGAIAALAIDLVTLYTARSEAQLAADGAALAAARVLANSGETSKPSGPFAAETLATAIATQVATHNDVGGRTLNSSEVHVSYNDGDASFPTNPHVTVKTSRVDLPIFFARIFGNNALSVSASATSEAYNPSGVNALGGQPTPVAPVCVKPWLLPNIDPTQLNPAATIFDPSSGAISNFNLIGQSWPSTTGANPNPNGLSAICGDCSPGGGGVPAAAPGQYYPGLIDSVDFPVPTRSLPAGTAGFNPYQLAVAGCVQTPIVCGANSSINIDTNPYAPVNAGGRDADTLQAVENLIHYVNGAGNSDLIDTTFLHPAFPFQFVGGNQNPVSGAVGQTVLLSDSLVTIPVINNPPGTPINPVQVIGFLQVFINSQSLLMPPPGTPLPNQIPATIINMAGCGINASATPILGNGASPVVVRLISGP